jgi:hypothetical protein
LGSLIAAPVRMLRSGASTAVSQLGMAIVFWVSHVCLLLTAVGMAHAAAVNRAYGPGQLPEPLDRHGPAARLRLAYLVGYQGVRVGEASRPGPTACPICLENDPNFRQECGHFLHVQCAADLRHRERAPRCPTCRQVWGMEADVSLLAAMQASGVQVSIPDIEVGTPRDMEGGIIIRARHCPPGWGSCVGCVWSPGHSCGLCIGPRRSAGIQVGGLLRGWLVGCVLVVLGGWPMVVQIPLAPMTRPPPHHLSARIVAPGW